MGLNIIALLLLLCCFVFFSSRIALSSPSIDVSIEYSLCSLILSGYRNPHIHHNPYHLPTPLIIEGRNSSVMSTFCKEILQKRQIFRIYLKCSIREQAIRFIEREFTNDHNMINNNTNNNKDAATIAKQHLKSSYSSLHDISHDVGQLPIQGIHKIVSIFKDNQDRDDSDRARYVSLYGNSKWMDYRVSDIYIVYVI